MNQTDTHPIITIDLVLDRRTTKEVLRAVLHSILFHRLFSTVKAQTFELYDVTMPGVDNLEVTQLVDDKVDIFWREMESGSSKRGQITVTFSEKRARKGWFLMAEEEIPWEQWIINAEIRQPPSDKERQFQADLSSTLTKSLRTMLTHASSEKGRAAVPIITHADGISPFPIKINVKVGGREVS